MFGNHFYHQSLKKSIGAFGSLFNDIYIVREEGSQVKVPITYSPRRKYLERIRERLADEQNIHDKIAIRLPRMSFEILAIVFDPERQLPRMNHCTVTNPDGSRSKIYSKTPYDISFQLSIYGKTQDDIFQVVEQIIPYFKPDYTLRMRPLEDHPEIIDNIPLSLQAVSFQDDYEGAMEDRREIVWSLDFDMKTAFYGPASADAKLIKEVDINWFLMGDSGDSDGLYLTSGVEVDPRDAGPDSDYTILETFNYNWEDGS